MKTLNMLIRRNNKLFFKDKGMIFTSLITPLILLVLFVTFLGKVYHESFSSVLPASFNVSEKLINGCVGGQLFSSLLAVCCVTVAFCSNMLMVHDKVSGARKDMMITPVKPSTMALGYYISTLINTLIICVIATAASFIYIATVGWYISFSDVLLLFFDVFILVMFGTALSSIVNLFLSTQGQISAVGTIVSSGYGFISGAYMPISSFGTGLQKVLAFFPGTYGTSMIRNHALRGVFSEMSDQGFPDDVVDMIKDSIDCNIYFFDKKVSVSTMYIIMISSVILLVCIYILLNILMNKKVKQS